MKKLISTVIILIGAAAMAPASAQSVMPFPSYEAVTIVRSMGLQPLTPPLRRGPTYLMHALDPYGEEMRVVVDARSGEILSAVPVVSGPPQPIRGSAYRPYPSRYYSPDAARGLDEDDYDNDIETVDRTIPLQPPRVIEAPRDFRPGPPSAAPIRRAAIAPTKKVTRPPIPRPRPEAATVSQAAPAPSPAKPAVKPESRPEVILKPTPDNVPPVAPLE